MKQSYYLSLLCFFLCISLSWGQLSKNYEVTTPGTLSQLVGADKAKITDLSLTGTLNSADFLTIRQMTALKNLDLNNAGLVGDALPEGAFRNMKINNVNLPKTLKHIARLAFMDITTVHLDFSKSTLLQSIGDWAFANAKIQDNVVDFGTNSMLTDFRRSYVTDGVFAHFSGKVILPSNLKTLSPSAFAQFKGEVSLPDGLEVLGEYSFAESSPRSVVLPKSLKQIGNYSFRDIRVDRLDFSKSTSLQSIGFWAFANAKIQDNVVDFGTNSMLTDFRRGYVTDGVFAHFSGKVILPSNLKTLSPSAFAQFKGEVSLPDGLEVLGEYSFAESSPRSVVLPKSLKQIGNYSFRDIRVDRLDFSKSTSLQSIGFWAFANAKIQDNVVDFGTNSMLTDFRRGYVTDGVFAHFSGKVILPSNLKTLSPSAFAQFKGEVSLPDGLEVLGEYSFAESSPRSVVLPKSLKQIGNYSFRDIRVDRLDFSKSTSLQSIGFWAFANAKIQDNVVDFGTNSMLTDFRRGYVTDGVFAHFSGKVILPSNLKTLSPSAFAQFKGEVSLPDGLEVLGEYSFAESSPRSVVLPKSLKQIGNYSFRDIRVDQLDFSKSTSLQSIGFWAFANAKIQDNVVDFGTNSTLTDFRRGYVTDGVFAHFSGKVILPSNLKTLSPSAFAQFKGEAVLPDGLEKISTQAFLYSTIKEISLPSSIQTIGAEAFSGCKELEKLSICAITPPQLGTEVFKGINFSKVELSVPKNTLAKYNQASQWKNFTVSVETDLCLAGPEIIKDPQVNAPNSYIFDVDAAKANNYGGLEIPVAKAYAMWETNSYLEGKGIPQGTLSASLYWEDVEGLVRSVSVNQNGKDSKIKVMINQSKGKGNAVVALHSGTTGDPLQDPVYWSWHIWVTDDPTQGKTYTNNQNGEMTNTFMDRNLGALSNSFLGHDWNRSGGLMYQWGRKDPLPVMRYIDNTFPKIYTLPFGKIQNSLQYFSVIKPGGTDTNKNIQYATQNPLRIVKWDPNENGNKDLLNWFSGVGARADLWGDNNQAKTGLVTYKPALKSSFDPCPSGWRVPSFAYSVDADAPKLPSYLPWGNGYKLGVTELLEAKEEDLSSESVRARYPSVKIYPGLGMDFKSGKGNYPLGQLPLTGQYRKYENDDYVYEDQASETYLWGATQAYKNGLREIDGRGLGLRIISDASQNGKKGFFQIQTANANATYSGQAVRCVIDTRISEIGSYPTQYLAPDVLDYTEGINNPNSYMIVKDENAQTIQIPVNKAYAMYNQYLTDHEWPAKEAKLSVNIYWTTDTNLLKKPVLEGTNENSTIKVTVNPNKSGNAVVSLHSGVNGDSNDKILWSWHIWVPNNSPVQNSVSYTTEEKFGAGKPDFKQLAYNTESFYPPLTTEFMDRNLGALEFDIASSDPNVYRHTGGMLYQWGRKDPIPSFYTYETHPAGGNFLGNYSIFKGNSINTYWHGLGIAEYEVYDVSYRDMFREGDSNRSVMKRSVENPLTVMFGPGYSPVTNKIESNWLPEKDPTLWGHATKKSPFDPCPEGWRVPDHGFSDSKNSPWKKENIDIEGSITKDYKGIIIADRGVTFTSESYNIGQLPFSGFRAYPLKVSEPNGVYYPGNIGGLWTATMAPGVENRSLALHYRPDLNTINIGYNMNPRIAMPIRCAKDQPRFTEESIANTPVNSSVRRNYVEAQSVEAQTSTLTESQIKITPNPTSGLFKVLLTGVTEGKLSVVNINGTVIHSQTFANSTEVDVNIQNQPSGVYVVQVQAQGQVVNKKVIKK